MRRIKKFIRIVGFVVILFVFSAFGCNCMSCDGGESGNSQCDLKIPLCDTFWFDGELRYRFNVDGTVDVIEILEDYTLKPIDAKFAWEYDNELLYFSSSNEKELVLIKSDDEESITYRHKSITMRRCDTKILSAIIRIDNDVCTVEIIYENGKFVYPHGFRYFYDEEALSEIDGLLQEISKVYIYPEDIKYFKVSFDNTSNKDIMLHSYMDRNYIETHHIVLPDPDDERFVGWGFKERIFGNINDLIDYAVEYNLCEVSLKAMYEMQDVDPIEGKYIFTKKDIQTHSIIISANKLSIFDIDGILQGEFEWIAEDGVYKIIRDIANEVELAGEMVLNIEDNSVEIITCPPISRILRAISGIVLYRV